MGVYIGTSELKNAYIGYAWTPGSNTILYAPFTGNLDTQGSYAVTLHTNTGTSYGTTNEGKVYLQQTNGRIIFAGSSVVPTIKTINYWFYPTNTTSQTFGVCVGGVVTGSHDWSMYTGVWSGKTLHDVQGSNNTEYAIFGTDGSVMNRWNLYTLIWNNSTLTGYLNGSVVGTKSTYSTLKASDYIVIGSNDAYCTQKISEVIMEGTARTSTEITNYYNKTKSDYGL